jgi:4-amino-4-deoxy-L-arabinose transferase-like glycosyltransferase
MAAYIGVTGAFQRASTTVVAARESMLWTHMVSSVLLYGLARRLNFRRGFAALSVLLFSLSPVGLAYQRFAFLDNVVMMWLIAGLFWLASPHRSARSGLAAGFCFGMAFWAKETMIILTPALMLFFWDHTDPRNRKVRARAAFGLYLGLVFAYPLFAWLKSELFPGPGHVSLIDTFMWQVHGRTPTGSLLDAGSQTHRMAMEWLHGDPVILAAGVLLTPLAVLSKRLRAIALTMLIQVDRIPTWLPRASTYALRTSLLIVLTAATVIAIPLVRPTLARAMSAPAYKEPQEAVAYTMRHVPKNAALVVDNYTFTDFALRGWWPLPLDKLELDPAVRQNRIHNWSDIDYILIGAMSESDKKSYPLTTTAVKNSKAIRSFTFGDDALTLRRVVKPKRRATATSGHLRP